MPDCTWQLDELLVEPAFARVIEMVTREVMFKCRLVRHRAHEHVVSGIGEPNALVSILRVWCSALPLDARQRLIRTIFLRKAIDSLRGDARRPGHSSFGVDPEDLGRDDDVFGWVPRNPREDLVERETAHLVRVALACFAQRGGAQQRQADLLWRYSLAEQSYDELSLILGCSKGALRVRVHKAMRAFGTHIEVCHPALLTQIDATARAG
jgi:hypothetical protein